MELSPLPNTDYYKQHILNKLAPNFGAVSTKYYVPTKSDVRDALIYVSDMIDLKDQEPYKSFVQNNTESLRQLINKWRYEVDPGVTERVTQQMNTIEAKLNQEAISQSATAGCELNVEQAPSFLSSALGEQPSGMSPVPNDAPVVSMSTPVDLTISSYYQMHGLSSEYQGGANSIPPSPDDLWRAFHMAESQMGRALNDQHFHLHDCTLEMRTDAGDGSKEQKSVMVTVTRGEDGEIHVERQDESPAAEPLPGPVQRLEQRGKRRIQPAARSAG
jgi:hypothetical protein